MSRQTYSCGENRASAMMRALDAAIDDSERNFGSHAENQSILEWAKRTAKERLGRQPKTEQELHTASHRQVTEEEVKLLLDAAPFYSVDAKDLLGVSRHIASRIVCAVVHRGLLVGEFIHGRLVYYRPECGDLTGKLEIRRGAVVEQRKRDVLNVVNGMAEAVRARTVADILEQDNKVVYETLNELAAEGKVERIRIGRRNIYARVGQ